LSLLLDLRRLPARPALWIVYHTYKLLESQSGTLKGCGAPGWTIVPPPIRKLAPKNLEAHAGTQCQRDRRSQCAACRQSRQIQEKAQDYSGFGLKSQTPARKSDAAGCVELLWPFPVGLTHSLKTLTSAPSAIGPMSGMCQLRTFVGVQVVGLRTGCQSDRGGVLTAATIEPPDLKADYPADPITQSPRRRGRAGGVARSDQSPGQH
jgi:hypothetical protein